MADDALLTLEVLPLLARLNEVTAERDRLRVIVDAAIAAREAEIAYLGAGWEARRPVRDLMDRLWSLTAGEGRRRG